MDKFGKIVQPTAEQLEKKNEDEYAFLQRQYRRMEQDATAFSQESRTMIQKQQYLIDGLRLVKRDVMTQVTVAQNPLNAKIDNRIAEDISSLLTAGDALEVEINKRRKNLIEVERDIHVMERAVKALRLKELTDFKVQQKLIKTEKAARVLEHRLHTATVKYCEVVAETKKLREQISHYLQERHMFNNTHRKLIAKVSEGKKVMLDLIEVASLAYDQREEAEDVLNFLHARKNQDLKTQTFDMIDLERKLDHQMRLKDFLASKGQKRKMIDLESKLREKRALQRHQREMLIANYTIILDDIRSYSNEEDTEKLAQMFFDQENGNFTIYTYAIELNKEVEALEEDVTQIRENIDIEHQLEKKRAQERGSTLKKLHNDLADKNADALAANTAMEDSKTKLTNILEQVEKLFHQMQGDNTQIKELLGGNEHVTEHNFMKYLEIIEEKIIEVMTKVFYIESIVEEKELTLCGTLVKRDQQPTFRAVEVETMAPTQPCAICVETTELRELGDDRVFALDRLKVQERLDAEKITPEFGDRLHNLSACRLPRSRKILQRRYM